MTRVEQLEEEIKKLSAEESAKLRGWLFEIDAQEWDREIERDAGSGKLHKLFEKSLADQVRRMEPGFRRQSSPSL